MFDEFATIAGSTASVLLLPIFALQGTRVRKRTPKVPGAEGAPFGTVTAGQSALSLLFLGESTIEGVGAATYADALVGQTAQTVAHLSQHTVHWHAVGKRGATVRRTIQELLPQVPKATFDMAVVALGVNDVLRFHRPARFRHEMTLLLSQLRSQIGSVPVVVAAVPEVGRFPILPQPLRSGLGLRARAFNIGLERMSQRLPQVSLVKTEFIGGNELLCEDRFHPSALGYQQWGQQLGRAIAQQIGTEG